MAITYPLELPDYVTIKRVNFYAVNAVTLSRSPFTFDTQVQEWAGNSWGAEVTLKPMERADADAWVAFLVSLNGPRGTFLLFDPLSILPRGSGLGIPKVKGAGQTGKTLETEGWTVDEFGVLLPGDKIQIGNRLYINLSVVDADSAGDATLDIWPRLRESPGDEEVIVTVRPRGLFRLAAPMVNLWSADETQIYDVSFQCVEAI